MGLCSVNYALAAMIVTAAEMGNPNYKTQTWNLYLLLLALLIVEDALTMNATRLIGWLNDVGTIVNLPVIIIFVTWFPPAPLTTLRSTTATIYGQTSLTEQIGRQGLSF
jgi:hypothetical protein